MKEERFHIASLEAIKNQRKRGYIESVKAAVNKHGRWEGPWGYLPEEIHAELRRDFTLSRSRSVPAPGLSNGSKPGLGDIAHGIFGPIGRAIHWPCMERDAAGTVTTELKPGSPCAKARNLLNKIA